MGTSWVRRLQWNGRSSRVQGNKGKPVTEISASSAFFNYTQFYKLQSGQLKSCLPSHFTTLCSRVTSHCVVRLTWRGLSEYELLKCKGVCLKICRNVSLAVFSLKMPLAID